jgi:hypothetical protein
VAPDITFRAAPPANFVAYGLEETARNVLDLLDHWSDYRIQTDELEDLGENSVLAVGPQHGTGKLSGVEMDYPIFIVWKFRESEVVGRVLRGNQGRCPQGRAAGVGDLVACETRIAAICEFFRSSTVQIARTAGI